MNRRPVRYAVIGTGMMGCEHITNLRHLPDAEVVAICDTNESSRDRGQLTAGAGVDVYADHRRMLERDDLDAVVIATPNFSHAALLDDVLGTDLAIMVEKPMCTTVDDCVRIRAAARGRTAITWVALEYRYMPTTTAVLTNLHTCGSLQLISIREHRFPFLVKVDNWNRFSENTGGTLVEKCCHFFDLMRLAADSDPVRVYASGGHDVNHLDEVFDGRPADILDNAFVIVDFANGVRAGLELSMFAEGGRYEQELTVTGSLGKIETTVPGDTIWVGPRDRSGPHALPVPPPDVGYTGFHHGASFVEHQRFIECLRTGQPAEVSVDDGLWSVVMGAAAHRSIDEQRAVLISEYDLV